MGGSNNTPEDVAEVKKCLHHVLESRKLLKDLESKLKETIAVITKTLSSLDAVGSGFVNTTRAMTQQLEGQPCSTTSRRSSVPVGTLHGATKLMSTMLHDLREGATLTDYKETLNKNIFDKMNTLRWSTKKVLDAGNESHALLLKYHKMEAIVNSKEKKYKKKGRDLNTSKRYTKQVTDREKAKRMAELKTAYFKDMYDIHVASVDQSEGEFFDCFIDANCHLVQKLHDTFSSVGSCALREYPLLTSVLVRAAGHEMPRLVNDDSPVTKTSRMKVGNDNGHVRRAEHETVQKSSVSRNPSVGSHGVGSPYLISHAEVDSSPSRPSGAIQEPLTQLRPPSAQDAPNEPSHFENGLKASPANFQQLHM
ncbi:hypothetical protein MOQ_009420 [Trypanosoma cruzi marinkellei]|uniref:BAR domain-containing protein n=1 Tax=Trypanosoma cruzi marinkellei TaxID=85056 RepID=K2NCR9_TRYCR|nr:hypothetical protein MOQ_009420 [Trypanosoma cruzi marinkellei]